VLEQSEDILVHFLNISGCDSSCRCSFVSHRLRPDDFPVGVCLNSIRLGNIIGHARLDDRMRHVGVIVRNDVNEFLDVVQEGKVACLEVAVAPSQLISRVVVLPG